MYVLAFYNVSIIGNFSFTILHLRCGIDGIGIDGGGCDTAGGGCG